MTPATPNTLELLVDDFVLGTLSPEETADAEARLATDPAFAAAVANARETYGLLGLALEPVAPAAAVRERLLGSVASTNRFERFAATVARLMDIAVDKATELLAAIDDAASWEPSPFPATRLYHLQGGPTLANAIVGFIEIQPGTRFPDHKHLGDEVVLVLQGSLQDEDGSIARTGDEVPKAAGTSHYFTVLDGPPLIYLTVTMEGVAFGELVLRPGDPRI